MAHQLKGQDKKKVIMLPSHIDKYNNKVYSYYDCYKVGNSIYQVMMMNENRLIEQWGDILSWLYFDPMNNALEGLRLLRNHIVINHNDFHPSVFIFLS